MDWKRVRIFFATGYTAVLALLLGLLQISSMDDGHAAWLTPFAPELLTASSVFAIAPFCVVMIGAFVSIFRRTTPAPPPPIGANSPTDALTVLMQVAHNYLLTLCKLPDPGQSRLRVTLFLPDRDQNNLFQVARYRWDGETTTTSTRVRFGTCDVGNAWIKQRPTQVASLTELGFEAALRECGLTAEEIDAHKLRDRETFASAPVFASPDDQLVYRREKLPNGKVLGVFSLDAAAPDCLAPDWPDRLAQVVFPALARAIESKQIEEPTIQIASATR